VISFTVRRRVKHVFGYDMEYGQVLLKSQVVSTVNLYGVGDT